MTKVAELIRAKGDQVHMIQKDTSVRQAARDFLEKDVSSLLVLDGDRVVGIFTKNDLVRCCCTHPEAWSRPVSQTMTINLFTAAPDADLEDVFAEMVRRGLHHVPVVEGDKAIGMLTPIDVLIHQRDEIGFQNRELMRYVSGSY